jgi:hypothetical protein
MIEEIQGRPEGTLEFKVTGTVTGDDYDTVLTPALERVLESNERVRLLWQVGPDFDGYTLGGAWDDARLGLRHWKGFERMALVTDEPWIETAVRALGFALPCPVKVFDIDVLEEARLWLSESLGSIRVDDLGEGTLEVKLLGQLETSAYDGVSDTLDDFIARHGRIKLLLDLSEFDGWQGLGALGEHLSLLRDHHHAPSRVAVVGDAAWQRLAERVASRFIDAEVQYFDAPDRGHAESWIAES